MFTHLKIKTASVERERAAKEKRKKTTQTYSRMMTSIERNICIRRNKQKFSYSIHVSMLSAATSALKINNGLL